LICGKCPNQKRVEEISCVINPRQIEDCFDVFQDNVALLPIVRDAKRLGKSGKPRGIAQELAQREGVERRDPGRRRVWDGGRDALAEFVSGSPGESQGEDVCG
jgi:hypothetical protein